MNPHETNTNPKPNKLLGFIKSNARRVSIACGLVLIGSVATYALADPLADLHELEDKYEARLMKKYQAADYYNIANHNWCMARVDLANEKLSLYYKGDLELEQKDMVRLANLVEAGCEPIPEPMGLAMNQTSSETVEQPMEEQLCWKKEVGHDQNQYVQMAADISNNDIDFLATLNQENGLWTPDRVHMDGVGRGFCGISYPWHKDIIEDPRFLSDPYWQLEQCWRLYSGGTRFYGYDVRHNSINKFVCPE